LMSAAEVEVEEFVASPGCGGVEEFGEA